jgi:hypothetical protein
MKRRALRSDGRRFLPAAVFVPKMVRDAQDVMRVGVSGRLTHTRIVGALREPWKCTFVSHGRILGMIGGVQGLKPSV